MTTKRHNSHWKTRIIFKKMVVANSMLELVGNTPMVRLAKLAPGFSGMVLAKLEFFNPAGSVKDRIGLSMIEEAEKRGVLHPGQTIVAPVSQNSKTAKVILEATGGNTGIALAFAAAVKGYRLILTMPENISVERQNFLRAFGAEIILTPREEGMRGAIFKAEEVKEEIPNCFCPRQFENKANPRVHHQTTAEEIWADTEGKIDIFVAGVGTGGTLMGVAENIKKKKPSVKIVAVEPAESALLSGSKPGSHKIHGIGAGFIPPLLKIELIDEILKVSSEEAIVTTRRLIREEGVLAGVSSGAAVHAALELTKRPENQGKVIVVILPDRSERYLDHPVFTDIGHVVT